MLTKESLLANEGLKGLTEDQITIIETLSKNDENTVLGAKFGEVYRQMDEKIEAATGIKRNGDEKTYLYLERAVKGYTEAYKDYDTIKAKVKDLEEQIAKGGDKALQEALDNAKKELGTTKDQYNALKASFDTTKAEYEKSLSDYKIDNEIARAKEGLKLKTGLNESALKTLTETAIATIKAKNPMFKDIDGVSTLIFHDANGTPLNNPENKLNPYTAKELLEKEFDALGILDKRAGGAGGGGQRGGTILTAKTKTEAYEHIRSELASKGFAKTDLRYAKEFDALCEKYKVKELDD